MKLTEQKLKELVRQVIREIEGNVESTENDKYLFATEINKIVKNLKIIFKKIYDEYKDVDDVMNNLGYYNILNKISKNAKVQDFFFDLPELIDGPNKIDSILKLSRFAMNFKQDIKDKKYKWSDLETALPIFADETDKLITKLDNAIEKSINMDERKLSHMKNVPSHIVGRKTGKINNKQELDQLNKDLSFAKRKDRYNF